MLNSHVRINQPPCFSICQPAFERLQTLLQLCLRKTRRVPPLKKIFKRRISGIDLSLLKDVLTKRFDLFDDCAHAEILPLDKTKSNFFCLTGEPQFPNRIACIFEYSDPSNGSPDDSFVTTAKAL